MFCIIGYVIRLNLGLYWNSFIRAWCIFGLGGYMMGMHLMREIGDRGVYGNPYPS